jgi:hypothetical protein
VPEDVCFQTKPEIALQQLRQVLADGVPSAPFLMDPRPIATTANGVPGSVNLD